MSAIATATAATTAPTADRKVGNQAKFAFIYEAGADPEISDAAYRVASLTALKKAGSKGFFKATRKEMAKLCAISLRKVDRAVSELARMNYWDVESSTGGANTIRLITPAERKELWDDAKRQWLDDEDRRIFAEKQAERERLEAEKAAHDEFIKTVNDAIREHVPSLRFDRPVKLDRGAVDQTIEAWWNIHQEHGIRADMFVRIVQSWTADDIPTLPKDDPQPTAGDTFWGSAAASDPDPDPVSRPSAGNRETDQIWQGGSTPVARGLHTDGKGGPHQWQGGSTPVAIPLATPDPLTSANGHSHKSLKDPERPLKALKDLESSLGAPRALERALCAGSEGQPQPQPADVGQSKAGLECGLCGPAGLLMDRDGFRVTMENDAGVVRFIPCRHSMASNIEFIKTLDGVDGFGLSRSCWVELDRAFGIEPKDYEHIETVHLGSGEIVHYAFDPEYIDG